MNNCGPHEADGSGRHRDPVSWITLALSGISLIGITYLAVKVRRSEAPLDVGEVIPLPSGLDSTAGRKELLGRIKDLYNAPDFAGLYRMLDEATRLRQPEERAVEVFRVIRGMTGDIRSGAYESYEVRAGPHGVKDFTLKYALETEKGRARMMVNVMQQGRQPYRLMGIGIHSEP